MRDCTSQERTKWRNSRKNFFFFRLLCLSFSHQSRCWHAGQTAAQYCYTSSTCCILSMDPAFGPGNGLVETRYLYQHVFYKPKLLLLPRLAWVDLEICLNSLHNCVSCCRTQKPNCNKDLVLLSILTCSFHLPLLFSPAYWIHHTPRLEGDYMDELSENLLSGSTAQELAF